MLYPLAIFCWIEKPDQTLKVASPLRLAVNFGDWQSNAEDWEPMQDQAWFVGPSNTVKWSLIAVLYPLAIFCSIVKPDRMLKVDRETRSKAEGSQARSIECSSSTPAAVRLRNHQKPQNNLIYNVNAGNKVIKEELNNWTSYYVCSQAKQIEYTYWEQQ